MDDRTAKRWLIEIEHVTPNALCVGFVIFQAVVVALFAVLQCHGLRLPQHMIRMFG